MFVHALVHVHFIICTIVHLCVSACVHAHMRACVHACVCVSVRIRDTFSLLCVSFIRIIRVAQFASIA